MTRRSKRRGPRPGGGRPKAGAGGTGIGKGKGTPSSRMRTPLGATSNPSTSPTSASGTPSGAPSTSPSDLPNSIRWDPERDVWIKYEDGRRKELPSDFNVTPITEQPPQQMEFQAPDLTLVQEALRQMGATENTPRWKRYLKWSISALLTLLILWWIYFIIFMIYYKELP